MQKKSHTGLGSKGYNERARECREERVFSLLVSFLPQSCSVHIGEALISLLRCQPLTLSFQLLKNIHRIRIDKQFISAPREVRSSIDHAICPNLYPEVPHSGQSGLVILPLALLLWVHSKPQSLFSPGFQLPLERGPSIFWAEEGS